MEEQQVQEKTQVQEQTEVEEQPQQIPEQANSAAQPESKPDQQQSGKSQYILQHDRLNCIGCAACEAVAPDFWEMNEDGKSDIKGGKHLDNEWQELDFEEKDLQINKEGADSCPVNVIHIVKKETGEKIV